MVVAVRPAFIALLVDVHEHVDCRVDRLEVVELVLAIPAVGQPRGGRVVLVEHTERGLANVGVVRMAIEPGAGEPAVPRPVVLRVRGGMNSHVSATSLDVALEIVLLCGVQYVASCVEEDNCAVSREVLRGERAGVFGRVYGEPILLSELPDSGDPDSDGAVAESGRLREDEYAGLLAACGDRDAGRSEQKREQDESLHGHCARPHRALTLSHAGSSGISLSRASSPFTDTRSVAQTLARASVYRLSSVLRIS